MPTFFAGVVGGLVFRIGIGAIPFLLPLLLQIGFGLTPFESGSLTFAAAAGAMAMKFTASTALRRFGFRRMLIVNALISGAFLAAYALFTPTTPHWLIFSRCSPAASSVRWNSPRSTPSATPTSIRRG